MQNDPDGMPLNFYPYVIIAIKITISKEESKCNYFSEDILKRLNIMSFLAPSFNFLCRENLQLNWNSIMRLQHSLFMNDAE